MSVRLTLAMCRYLVPATGQIEVNGVPVRACEGLIIRNEERISIRAVEED